MTKQQEIKCPNCNESISIDEVLTHQIEDRIKKELQEENKSKEAEMARDKKKLKEEKVEFEEMQKNAEIELNKKVAEKVESEKTTLKKQAQEEANKEKEAEKRMFEEQLAEKDEKLKEANKNELALRKEKQKLKDEKDAFELEKTRQLDEERKNIEENASKKATEIQQSKIDQLNKQLQDATKAKDELARKLAQGSQQTQGEVLELQLEDMLRNEFPFDEIIPVPKGVSGADTIQKVHDQKGQECGQIVWESKKTKSWSDGWIQKLKDDQRRIKADLAVIVSEALPEGVKGFIFRDGIWICDIRVAMALATSLRVNLESLNREKMMSVGKNEKMEVLYSYLTGVEFKQRVEAIVEAFTGMDEGLKKEKLVYQKLWAEREKQIQKVINNTAGMYGDLSGLVSLPKITILELEEGTMED